MSDSLMRIRAAITALEDHFAQADEVFQGSAQHAEWLDDMAASLEEMIESAGLMFEYTEEQERLQEVSE